VDLLLPPLTLFTRQKSTSSLTLQSAINFVNASKVIGDIHTFSIYEGFGNRAELGYTRSVHQEGNSPMSSELGTLPE